MVTPSHSSLLAQQHPVLTPFYGDQGKIGFMSRQSSGAMRFVGTTL